MTTFSVPVTDASSRKMSAPTSLLGDEAEGSVYLDARAQLLEGEHMRVDAPAPDDVASGRRELDLAEAREEGAREEYGGPDLASLLGRDVGAA